MSDTSNTFNREALRHSLSIVLSFDGGPTSRTAKELAESAGIDVASTEARLEDLVAIGMARHLDGGFTLTPLALRLADAYLTSLRVPELAKPRLETLRIDTGESTSAAVLDGTQIMYVCRVPSTADALEAGIEIGTRFPAHATSMGRVMLAALTPTELDAYFAAAELTALTAHTVTDETALREELDRVRRQGWAIVDRELTAELTSIAAPVRDGAGRVVAAVNVSFADLDYRPALTDARPLLLTCARELSADLATR